MHVIITKHWVESLVGIIGRTTGEEEFYNGNTFYEVVCENDGPYVSTSRIATKKIRSWKIGDTLHVTIDSLLVLVYNGDTGQ